MAIQRLTGAAGPRCDGGLPSGYGLALVSRPGGEGCCASAAQGALAAAADVAALDVASASPALIAATCVPCTPAAAAADAREPAAGAVGVEGEAAGAPAAAAGVPPFTAGVVPPAPVWGFMGGMAGSCVLCICGSEAVWGGPAEADPAEGLVR
jgi:hypothetical protein